MDNTAMQYVKFVPDALTLRTQVHLLPGARVKVVLPGQEAYHLFDIVVTQGGSLEVRAVYHPDGNGHMAAMSVRPFASNVVMLKGVK